MFTTGARPALSRHNSLLHQPLMYSVLRRRSSLCLLYRCSIERRFPMKNIEHQFPRESGNSPSSRCGSRRQDGEELSSRRALGIIQQEISCREWRLGSQRMLVRQRLDSFLRVNNEIGMQSCEDAARRAPAAIGILAGLI